MAPFSPSKKKKSAKAAAGVADAPAGPAVVPWSQMKTDLLRGTVRLTEQLDVLKARRREDRLLTEPSRPSARRAASEAAADAPRASIVSSSR